MPETLEKIMKETGCCNTCNGCIECDCPKNRENGPRELQVDMARVDYDLNLASGG